MPVEKLHAKSRRVPNIFRTMAHAADVGRVFQGRRLDGLNWIRWSDNTGSLYFTDYREVFFEGSGSIFDLFQSQPNMAALGSFPIAVCEVENAVAGLVRPAFAGRNRSLQRCHTNLSAEEDSQHDAL